MSTNLEYREERDREKEKVGDRPAKNKGDILLLEKQHENFVAAVGK